jgi:hypothetical protein
MRNIKMLKFTFRTIFVLSILLTTVAITSYQADAQVSVRTQETKWGIVENSLSELLNNGWMPINITATDVATAPEPGLPNLRSPGLRSESFVYLLTKNGKYITCGIANPRSNSKNYSYCRSIN